MQHKPTPGPWSILDTGRHVVDSTNLPIAFIAPRASSSEEILHANMVRALPALYEALRAVRYLFGVLASDTDPIAAHAIKMADAALAQAEGREP